MVAYRVAEIDMQAPSSRVKKHAGPRSNNDLEQKSND